MREEESATHHRQTRENQKPEQFTTEKDLCRICVGMSEHEVPREINWKVLTSSSVEWMNTSQSFQNKIRIAIRRHEVCLSIT